MTIAHTTVGNLRAGSRNPRSALDPHRLQTLRRALAEYGDLSGVVYNTTTGELVGGHQRARACSDARVVIDHRHEPATRTGTVATGHVDMDGERHAYREVSWPREKQEMATIVANNNAGDWDRGMLAEMLRDLADMDMDMDLTMFDARERETLSFDLPAPPVIDEARNGRTDHAPDASTPDASPADDLRTTGRETREIEMASLGTAGAVCPRCKFEFDPN